MNPSTTRPSRKQDRPAAHRGLTAVLVFMLMHAGAVLAQPDTNPVTTLRGRVDRWTGAYGRAGVPFVKVSLLDPDNDSAVSREVTDSEGIFRFRGVGPGAYVLRVDRERPGCGLMKLPVSIKRQPREYTDIPAVLVHELRFSFDRLEYPAQARTVIVDYAYDNPPDWPVYVLAADEKEKLKLPPLWRIRCRVPGEDSLVPREQEPPELLGLPGDSIKPWSSDQPGFDGGSWKGLASFNLDKAARSIHALLLTAEGMQTVDSLTAAGANWLDRLPAGTRALTGMPLYEED
jgi:hypothetical protein